MQRRQFLTRASAALAAFGLPLPLLEAMASPLPLGERHPFDYAWLKGHARALAGKAFSPRSDVLPPPVAALNWDQYQSIAFRQDHALWGDVPGSKFQAKFFHLGIYFKRPVRMFEVAGGQAQELAYDPAMFDFGKSGLKGQKLPQDLGFAGFRLNSPDDIRRDWAAFLGASYFRAVGSSMQYGLSARGLAIDTGMPRPEEFPDFTAFWLERPEPGSETVVVYALLDSPSVAGAYRFAITKGELDFGPWEQIFYGEFDGLRRKRALVKIIGE